MERWWVPFSDYPENPMYRHLTRYLRSFSTAGVDLSTAPDDQNDGVLSAILHHDSVEIILGNRDATREKR